MIAAFDFGDAIDFIVNGRESVTGGLQVGGSQLLPQLWRHLELTGASVGIACLVAIPLALWLGHLRKGQFAVASIANVGRAVPSLALIGFAVAYIGLGFPNALLALTLLAIPPIFVNTYVGIASVEPEIVDAARGQGMTEPQVVRKVEMPLAVAAHLRGRAHVGRQRHSDGNNRAADRRGHAWRRDRPPPRCTVTPASWERRSASRCWRSSPRSRLPCSSAGRRPRG
jgi:ABC-type Fe3+ transport system permease subunit